MDKRRALKDLSKLPRASVAQHRLELQPPDAQISEAVFAKSLRNRVPGELGS
jgi:hypothetical protein